MKKFIAFALVLVLVLTLCATAFAARPTVTIKSSSKNKKVWAGNILKLKFSVNSKSYSGKWAGGKKYARAAVMNYLYKGGYRWSDVYFNGFSGRGTFTVKWSTRGLSRGKWYVKYTPAWRSSIYDNYWYYLKSFKKVGFTVK